MIIIHSYLNLIVLTVQVIWVVLDEFLCSVVCIFLHSRYPLMQSNVFFVRFVKIPKKFI